MKRFPVGGEREPVYSFIRDNGYRMDWCDKYWKRADGVTLHLYGAGSMARITNADGKLLAEAPLAEAVAKTRW